MLSMSPLRRCTNFYRQLLYRFQLLTVHFLDDYLGLAELELVTLAAHGLDEHCEVQDATAKYLEFFGRIGVLDAECEVFLGLLHKTLAEVARSYKLAFLAEEWRIVDGEQHTHRRLVNVDAGEFFGVFGVGNGIADVE